MTDRNAREGRKRKNKKREKTLEQRRHTTDRRETTHPWCLVVRRRVLHEALRSPTVSVSIYKSAFRTKGGEGVGGATHNSDARSMRRGERPINQRRRAARRSRRPSPPSPRLFFLFSFRVLKTKIARDTSPPPPTSPPLLPRRILAPGHPSTTVSRPDCRVASRCR